MDRIQLLDDDEAMCLGCHDKSQLFLPDPSRTPTAALRSDPSPPSHEHRAGVDFSFPETGSQNTFSTEQVNPSIEEVQM